MVSALRILSVAQLVVAVAGLRADVAAARAEVRALPAQGLSLQEHADPRPQDSAEGIEDGLNESLISKRVAQVSQGRLPGRRGLAWVFVAHHKSGTKLLQKLARVQATVMNLSRCTDNLWLPDCTREGPSAPMGIWFLTAGYSSGSRAALEGKDVRLVHIIRDPVAMVVSGYIYHTRQGPPNDTPPALRRGAQMPPRDALALEAQYVLNTTGPAMARDYTDSQSTQMMKMNVRFEDFDASSASFNRTVAELYNFTVGDMVSRAEMERLAAEASMHDLHRHSMRNSVHFAPQAMEEQARRMLSTIPKHTLDDLYRLRAKLGY